MAPGVAGRDDKLVVTLVTDTSGIGDKGFNEICRRGLMRAWEELGIVVKKIESSDPADYVKNLSIAARYSNLTVANGFLLVDAVARVSAVYPESGFGHARSPGKAKGGARFWTVEKFIIFMLMYSKI